MASRRQKLKIRKPSAAFVSMEKRWIKNENWASLSPKAVKMFFDLYVEYNSSNNGDFCASLSVMRKKGWNSNSQIRKAIQELMDKGWIVLSRQGAFRDCCNLYAVTIWPIDECGGKLDISPTHTAPNYWRQIKIGVPN